MLRYRRFHFRGRLFLLPPSLHFVGQKSYFGGEHCWEYWCPNFPCSALYSGSSMWEEASQEKLRLLASLIKLQILKLREASFYNYYLTWVMVWRFPLGRGFLLKQEVLNYFWKELTPFAAKCGVIRPMNPSKNNGGCNEKAISSGEVLKMA